MLDAKDISIIKEIMCEALSDNNVILRQEFREENTKFREELRAEIKQSKEELREELRAEIKQSNEELRAELRAEIKQSNEELRVEIKQSNEELRKEFYQSNEELRNEFYQVNEDTKTSLKGYFQECMEKNNELIFDEMERYYQMTRKDIQALEKKVMEIDNYYRISRLEEDVSGKVLRITDRHETMLNKHERQISELQQKMQVAN